MHHTIATTFIVLIAGGSYASYCAEPKTVASLKQLCMSRMKSPEFLAVIRDNPEQRAFFNTNPLGLELFCPAQTLTHQIDYNPERDCRKWCYSGKSCIQAAYNETDALDPELDYVNCEPFGPITLFRRDYVPLYYKRQAYATADAVYVVTARERNSSQDPDDTVTDFTILKINHSDCMSHLQPLSDLESRYQWHRISNDRYRNIRYVSLLPGTIEDDEPRMLLTFIDDTRKVVNKTDGTCGSFPMPAYCYSDIGACLADDPQSGKRVMYDKKKGTFWLVHNNTGFSLPITKAIYAFFFDQGKSLYVYESHSSAYCIDLATNQRYAIPFNSLVANGTMNTLSHISKNHIVDAESWELSPHRDSHLTIVSTTKRNPIDQSALLLASLQRAGTIDASEYSACNTTELFDRQSPAEQPSWLRSCTLL